MRIATLGTLITTLVAGLSLASFGVTLLHAHLVQEQKHNQRILADAQAAIELLAEGSDRLTNAARAYAITGDEQYRQTFHGELDTLHSREQASARLRTLGASPKELELITLAKRRSDTLLDTERQALSAMARGERQDALALLYSPDYTQAKADIAAPLEQAEHLINTRLQERIHELSSQAQVTDTLALGLLGSNTLLILGVLHALYRRRLIVPITSMTDKVRRLLAEREANVHFDEGTPGSEIADLAHALEDARQASLNAMLQASQLEQQARELVSSEERLRHTKAWYRGLIESAPDAVLVADEHGIIRLANLRLESLFGYAPGELLGRPLTSLAPPHAMEHYAELPRRLIQENTLAPQQLPGARQDGSEFPLELTLALLPADADQPASFCAVLRDISERLASENEMRRARTLAEQAAQTKSDFLANVSHEVRTPLNTIVGMTHLLGKTLLDNTQGDYLRQIQLAGEQLRAVVDDILDFSRIEDGELELERSTFALQELLDGLNRRFAEPARSKGLHFICVAASDLPAHLIGDPQRIGQILAHFVDNALKFTAEGEIEISLGGHRLASGQFELNAFVRDTGIGLTAEQQESLFDLFYQADSSITRRYGGTGLGLALSHKLAGLMDGNIGVQSHHGQGSTFWLSIPLGIASHGQPKPRSTSDLRGCRVLLAEDHEVNQRLICKLLEHVGVRVEVAENGREAVDRVRLNDYDMVLMDMQMPVLDGAGATLEIRQLGSRGQLPIIAISASAMPEDRRRCSEVGMNGFLAKPVKVEELYATLRQWCQLQPVPALPSGAATPALPQVTGLDTDEGLRRTMGDRALYLELLRGLVERERDTPQKIRRALAHADHATAERMAHTLKGLAATVGARDVMRQAGGLEQALRDKREAPLLEEAAANLERHLRQLLGALEEALETTPQPTNEPAPAQLTPICAKLAFLLSEDDADAAAWFNEHSRLLRAAFPNDYPQLENAIRNFEFAGALAALQALMSRQQLPSHTPNNA